MIDLEQIGRQARRAVQVLATAPTSQKNAALTAIADALITRQVDILAANAQDVAEARAGGLTDALIDRLTLTPARLEGIAADVRKVVELPDPVGMRFDERTLPNGLHLYKQRTPMGVLGVIYESRPNVTVDVAALALKSGNGAILRGGKETLRSNIALCGVVQHGLAQAGLPAECVQYIEDTSREYVLGLLRLSAYVDMIIPRGGAGLHDFCRENATIPVITGGLGICHLFVDDTADLDRSVDVIHNAKTQRPSVCNALDTALVHRTVAREFLPRLVERLDRDGVVFKAEPGAYEIVGGMPGVEAAQDGDFDTEWMALILGLKVVDGLDQAIEHIRQHSTGHSDGILTRTQAHADAFVQRVDSAAVYVNASTRFTDGAQFGLGAEVAISTQRLHARGPMALEELTTYKWVGIGDMHVRA
ncbi:MAG: glutamate-5-semialdehyde dehydrogenase [Anaerolineae bacterium]|nr:glutamate-5-semialdehyde dehydrogenase [Anaerolineae bacterium]